MTPFEIKSLSNDDLLLFCNVLGEMIVIFDDDSQFSTRIGVDRNYAEELRVRLVTELDKRPEF